MNRISLTALPATFLRVVSCATTLALFVTAMPQALLANREGECESDIRDVNPGPGSLKHIRPVEPTGLADYVQVRQAAILLGKAFFWDMQVGSDGVQSCGTCHFRAGADPRSKGQLAPGGQNINRNVVDLGNNTQLRPDMFPLTKFADPTNRQSRQLRTSDDVVSSQGVHSFNFRSAEPGEEEDNGTLRPDSVFNVAGVNVRRVEPRNTPTMINAAFNRRNFWDGRADHIFNGVNPFGVRDPNARVLKATNRDVIEQVKVRIDNASLASQAVGPILSTEEMSFFDRPLRDIGRRLMSATPLAKQVVAEDDSVLGLVSLSKVQGEDRKGLVGKYLNYVQVAFKREWWDSSKIVVVGPNNSISFRQHPGRALAANEYTMAEYNFPLFFGLAVQLYEMTLISDDAPIDRFFDGNTRAISDSAKRGMAVFQANACAGCHSGAEFTNASVRILNGANGEPAEIIERMPTGNCNIGLYDQSFYNIGVRPYWEDLGIGNSDPFGNPLAIAKVLTTPRGQIPSQELFSISYPNIVPGGPRIGERTIEKGAFKVPSLRNIELTAPYFHNGGQATLRQAIEFYNRGGDFRDVNVEFVDLEIGKLNLTEQQIDDVVEFLKTLTDERVRRAAAPFDHPQLFVPNGAQGDNRSVRVARNGASLDDMIEVRATGRNGAAPLRGFLE